MVCLVVNAISVKEGGSLVVLRELVKGIRQLRPEWTIHVVASDEAVLELQGIPTIEIHTYSKVSRSSWRTRVWYELGLIRLLKNVRADVLFSHTNYLPIRKTPCKRLLLEQHAGHFSLIFHELMYQTLKLRGRIAWRMKGNWVRRSVVAAEEVTVQTAALADAISSSTSRPRERITVIPHGIGLSNVLEKSLRFPSRTEPFVVGYTTKFGVQKNFDVVFLAISELKRRGLNCRLEVTLNPNLAENHQLLRKAEQLGLEKHLTNLGELSPQDVSNVYARFHAFVFPSLCESFGFPLVEAMANNLPVVVAETASNREVAAEAGIYFSPHDFLELADHLQKLASDPHWYSDRVSASQARQSAFSWERAAIQTTELIERMVTDGSQPGVRQ